MILTSVNDTLEFNCIQKVNRNQSIDENDVYKIFSRDYLSNKTLN